MIGDPTIEDHQAHLPSDRNRLSAENSRATSFVHSPTELGFGARRRPASQEITPASHKKSMTQMGYILITALCGKIAIRT